MDMKKMILLGIVALIMIGCAAIGQVEGTTNEAKIERIAILPDSTSLYFIYWKGHTFLYDGNKISEVK